MCGIMGFVRTKGWTKDTARYLTALMCGIEIRGDHAAGVAYLPSSKSIKVCYGKAACPTSTFIFGKSWTEAMALKSEAIIGHARWATHGTVKNQINNHPHVSKSRRYALVHNGVIVQDLGVKIEGQCDSEKILSLFKKGGVKLALDKLTALNTGSYAVLALDAKEKLLHAFRNIQSPMVISDMTDIVGGIVFASTMEIMEDALTICEIKRQPQIYTVVPAIDFTFPIPCRPGIEQLKLPIATYTKVTTYSSTATSYPGFNYGYVNDYGVTKPKETKPFVPKGNLTYTEKERRDRWRLLSNDETPLDFVLRRTAPGATEEKIYKTWKEYFKDFPSALGEAQQRELDLEIAEEAAQDKVETQKLIEQMRKEDDGITGYFD